MSRKTTHSLAFPCIHGSRKPLLPAICLLLLATALRAQTPAGAPTFGDAAAITFIKEFPGSSPAYYSITMRELDGGKFAAEYRIEPDEEPTEMEISAASGQRAFALAGELGWFAGPQIESGRNVAKMGVKTLRYESGARRHEAVYNHTELPAAMELNSWFEKLSATQQHIDRIEYLLRFDKLGIVKELLQTEMDLNSDRLLEPALLLPALKKVLANKSLVNVAHDRSNLLIARLSALAATTPQQ